MTNGTTTNETTTEISNPAKPLLKRVIVLTMQAKAEPGKPSQPGVFRLNKERVVLGSVVSADVRLGGDGVAPIHAVIELGEKTATVYDLASESGVFVNGKKAVTQELKEGDVVQIGHHSLRFSIDDAARMSVKD